MSKSQAMRLQEQYSCHSKEQLIDVIARKEQKIFSLERRMEELKETKTRLWGQLQNCINHLDRCKRKGYGLKLDDCIESANKCLYETLQND